MAALELLGIPSAGTRRVQIFPDCIIVEQLRRDASGSLFSAGADIATVKTSSAWRRSNRGSSMPMLTTWPRGSVSPHPTTQPHSYATHHRGSRTHAAATSTTPSRAASPSMTTSGKRCATQRARRRNGGRN